MTAATPGQEPHAADGKTAGQQAYEALMRSITDRNPDVPVVLWERLDDLARDGYTSGDTQADWEAAGRAVETQQLRLAREGRDSLRKRMLDLADELEDEGAEYDQIVGDGEVRLLAERLAAQARMDAARIRQIAEPPS